MITQAAAGTQAEILESVLNRVPVIMHDGMACIYILIKELCEETERFILTGRSDTDVLHVFSEDYETALISEWTSLGLSCRYRNQPFDYMHRHVTIKYICVSNPETGLEISLIPWFIVPGRPYPIFTYVYAIWHYVSSEHKSMELTATVTGEIFGISSFDKSTVSRCIKTMEQLVNSLQIDEPLSIDEPDTNAAIDVIEHIPGILESCLSIETLKVACGVKCAQCPHPIRRAGNTAHAFNRIPEELSKVLKDKEIIRKHTRDKRNRPARSRKEKNRPAKPQKEKERPVQRRLDFVESQRLRQIRMDFIASCKAIVMNVAIKYHRFLI